MMNLYSECNLRRICLGGDMTFRISARAYRVHPYTPSYPCTHIPIHAYTHTHTRIRLVLSARSAFMFYRSRVMVRRVVCGGAQGAGVYWKEQNIDGQAINQKRFPPSSPLPTNSLSITRPLPVSPLAFHLSSAIDRRRRG